MLRVANCGFASRPPSSPSTCILCLYTRAPGSHKPQPAAARSMHSPWTKDAHGNAARAEVENKESAHERPQPKRIPFMSNSPSQRPQPGGPDKWGGSGSFRQGGFNNQANQGNGQGEWRRPVNFGRNNAGYNPPSASGYRPGYQSPPQSTNTTTTFDFLDQIMMPGRGVERRQPAWGRRPGGLPNKTEQDSENDASQKNRDQRIDGDLGTKIEQTVLSVEPAIVAVESIMEDPLEKKKTKNVLPDTKREKKRNKERGKRSFGVAGASFFLDEAGDSAKEVKKEKKKKREQPIPLLLPEYITVSNLARKLRQPLEQFMEKLKVLGFEGLTHDYVLNAENAGLIAMEFNYDPIVDTSQVDDILPRPPPEDKSALQPRPPVVTIMGHVDHGKTTLLDWLRKSSIAATEHGGITQHIGAFSVPMPSGKIITFLDTPGHAAFLSMRERGANVTDIVILVVAGDDSVKPQTLEAIQHAKAANVPMIVAITKCDKPGVSIEKVKSDLGRHNVEIEDIGGDVQVIQLSAKTGDGMGDLEEAIIALAEILDMRAETDGPCEGWILEAATRKRGRVATVLIRRGTLRPGDILVAGHAWARVRKLVNEHGHELPEAGPGTPVEVDGWKDQPDAGQLAIQAESEERAKDVVVFRRTRAERLRQATDIKAINLQRQQVREGLEHAKLLAENPDNPDLATPATEATDKCKDISFVIKADVSGSAEAVVNAVSALGNAEVRAKIIRSSFGPVTEFDIDHAAAAKGFVLAFNLPIESDISNYARTKGVEVISSKIIYDLQDRVHAKMSEFLAPKVTIKVTGEAEVLELFNYNVRSRVYHVYAGCKVKQGSLKKKTKTKVLRNKEVVHNGILHSLKSYKTDTDEVKKDKECGVGFDDYQGFQPGDLIQCYEEVVEARKLPPIIYGR